MQSDQIKCFLGAHKAGFVSRVGTDLVQYQYQSSGLWVSVSVKALIQIQVSDIDLSWNKVDQCISVC